MEIKLSLDALMQLAESTSDQVLLDRLLGLDDPYIVVKAATNSSVTAHTLLEFIDFMGDDDSWETNIFYTALKRQYEYRWQYTLERQYEALYEHVLNKATTCLNQIKKLADEEILNLINMFETIDSKIFKDLEFDDRAKSYLSIMQILENLLISLQKHKVH